MNHNIQSRKKGEVAELPLKLNLQLFAEDEAESTETQEPAYVEPDEPEDVVWEPFDSDKPKEEPEQAAEPEVAEPDPEKPKQDHETNKAFQEMRKAKEEADRKAKAADEWAKQQYGHLGIETFEQYQQALQEEQRRKEYEEKGVDYDEVRKIAKEEAENHPEVIRAKQDAQRMEVNNEIRELKAAHPDVDLTEIERLDPAELRAMLAKLPNWEQMEQRVNRGYSLKDAYELANRETIEKKRLEAVAQAERNKINGKNHMKPSGTAETGDAIILTAEEESLYRQMFKKQLKNGTMTMDQIHQRHKQSVQSQRSQRI